MLWHCVAAMASVEQIVREQVYDASFSRRAGLVQRRRPQGRRCACRLGGRRCSQLIDHLQSRDATHCWFCERAAQYGDCVCECTACFAPVAQHTNANVGDGTPACRREVVAQHANASVGDGTPACRREVVAQHTNASVGDGVPAFRREVCAVCSNATGMHEAYLFEAP